MSIDNEELMIELQRVSAQVRSSRHGRTRGHGQEGEGDERMHDGAHGEPGRRHGHHHGHAYHGHRGHGMPNHPIGSHKCHGGSGRHGQNRILAVLVMQDGTSQKDLAYLLGIRPQSLTQALDSLEEGGFVERRQDDQDKRINRVYLTDAGRGRAAKVAEDRKQYAEDVFSVLTDEEKQQLADILAKLSASLGQEPEPQE